MTNYIYKRVTEEEITISYMIHLANTYGEGPQPYINKKTDYNVYAGEGVFVPFNKEKTHYEAFPLTFDAAVIFVSNNQGPNAVFGGYLYHAKDGNVSQSTFDTAIAALGNPPLDSVFVIYTFPVKSTTRYEDAANNIVGYGLPAENLIYAPNLSGSSFGINSQGLVG